MPHTVTFGSEGSLMQCQLLFCKSMRTCITKSPLEPGFRDCGINKTLRVGLRDASPVLCYGSLHKPNNKYVRLNNYQYHLDVLRYI